MTELIVALDGDLACADAVWHRLRAGVAWFKVGHQVLMQGGGSTFIPDVGSRSNLFLDLKLYDTVDTVAETARRAWDLGARMLTVHATPRMLEAATRTKPAGDRCKVLAVKTLTDEMVEGPYPPIELADGVICSVRVAKWFRQKYITDKLLICPGIRAMVLVGTADNEHGRVARYTQHSDNHVKPATPAEARNAGADFAVVGRPITLAADPVAAARAYLEELR